MAPANFVHTARPDTTQIDSCVELVQIGCMGGGRSESNWMYRQRNDVRSDVTRAGIADDVRLRFQNYITPSANVHINMITGVELLRSPVFQALVKLYDISYRDVVHWAQRPRALRPSFSLAFHLLQRR